MNVIMKKIALTRKNMKNFKNMRNIGRGKEVGEKPTTLHTPGETPTPLTDLADLAPNPVQFQTLAAFLFC